MYNKFSRQNNSGRNGKRINNTRLRKKPRKTPDVQLRSDMTVIGLRPLSEDRQIVQDFRFSATLSSSVTGTVSTVFSLRDPARAINGSGTFSDITDIANVFDQYKVMKYCIEYTPIPAINSFSLPPLYLATDFDDTDAVPLTTYAQANAYSNRIIWDSRYSNAQLIRVPEITSGVSPTNTPCIIHKDGFMDFANPPVNGVVYMVGTGFPNSLQLGVLSLTMRLCLKYQR